MPPSRASNFAAIFAERIAQQRFAWERLCPFRFYFVCNYLHPAKFWLSNPSTQPQVFPCTTGSYWYSIHETRSTKNAVFFPERVLNATKPRLQVCSSFCGAYCTIEVYMEKAVSFNCLQPVKFWLSSLSTHPQVFPCITGSYWYSIHETHSTKNVFFFPERVLMRPSCPSYFAAIFAERIAQ